MTTNQENPSNIDERLEKIAKLLQETSELAKENAQAIKELREESKMLREESKEQNIKFAAYQQASQWVVNLAFSLIAGATVITVASAIFKR